MNLGLSLCLALDACAVGPNFTPPKNDVPAAYTTRVDPKSGTDTIGSQDAAHATWWHEFHDDELDRLVERAQKGNLDLQAGVLRIIEARTQVQIARAQGLPTLNASASYMREQLGVAGILKAQGGGAGAAAGVGAGGAGGAAGAGAGLSPELMSLLTSPINLYQIGFDASWELDLFGKVRRNVEAAKEQRAAAVESRNDMLVSLESEVATDYAQLRAAQQLRKITAGLIADEQEVSELTENRQKHGLAQESDVQTARAQVSNLQSQLPQYDENVAVARHALAVLIGQTPESLDAELGPTAELPAPPRMLPVGVPSELARRRPDIREAEASLHAATADVGVAVASLFPDISLAGTYGLRNTSTHYLFDWASHFYTAGPTVSLPIFQGGALVANVRMARAQAASAALSYRKTVLSALQDVEDALVNLDQDAIRVAALKETVGADSRAFEITLHSYEKGLSTYLTVLNVGVQADQAKQTLAQAQLAQINDVVKLYKALGGGWQTDAVAAAAADPIEAAASRIAVD